MVGLLNYPELVGSMSEYLDWTQLLGTAVVEQIDAVQASIQILRLAAVDRGILVSNEVQKVVETDGVVMVAPASKDTDVGAAVRPGRAAGRADARPRRCRPPRTAAGGTTVIVNVEQPATAPAEPPPAEPEAAGSPLPATPAGGRGRHRLRSRRRSAPRPRRRRPTMLSRPMPPPRRR